MTFLHLRSFDASVACLLLLLALRQPLARAQSDLESVNVSLDRLLNFIHNNGGDQTAEAMAIKLIEIYGLSFRPTEADFAKLRSANASVQLVGAVANAKMPRLQPPAIRYGALLVTCRPVDCEVEMNFAPAGSTRNGFILLPKLEERDVSISVSHADYDPVPTQTAAIKGNSIERLLFVLRPSTATLARLGAARYQQMMKVTGLGGAAAPRIMQIAGSVTSHEGRGQSTTWRIFGQLSGGTGSLDFVRARERYYVDCGADGCRSGKKVKNASVQQLGAIVKSLAEAQLGQLFRFGSSPELVTTAVLDGSGNERSSSFKVADPSAAYLVTLDPLGRPAEVRYESGVFPSGTRILFADYREQEGSLLPATVQVALPGEKRGLDIRLDTTEYRATSSRDRHKAN